MRYRGMFTAMALLLVVNLIVLAGAFYNRQGDPVAALLLSERELPMAWNSFREENTGIAFQLSWHRYNQDLEWFDEEKLEALGIDTLSRLRSDSNGSWHQTLPIKAYVVLEFDGPAWQAFVRTKEEELAEIPELERTGALVPEAAERKRQSIENELRSASRLFPVDVGSDPDDLRSAYPDRARHLITTAEMRGITAWKAATDDNDSTYRIKGRIDRILIERIHVPRPFHAILQQIPDGEKLRPHRGYYGGDPRRPHYQVRLAYGQRFEPWIQDILPIAPPAEETQHEQR